MNQRNNTTYNGMSNDREKETCAINKFECQSVIERMRCMRLAKWTSCPSYSHEVKYTIILTKCNTQ